MKHQEILEKISKGNFYIERKISNGNQSCKSQNSPPVRRVWKDFKKRKRRREQLKEGCLSGKFLEFCESQLSFYKLLIRLFRALIWPLEWHEVLLKLGSVALDCLLLERSLVPERVAGKVFWGLHWWKRGSLGSSLWSQGESLHIFSERTSLKNNETRVDRVLLQSEPAESRVEGQETPRGRYASPRFWEISGSLWRCMLEMDSAFSCARSLVESIGQASR